MTSLIWQKFGTFWREKECDASVLAAFRIFFGGVVFVAIVLIGFDRDYLFLHDGFLSEQARDIIASHPSMGYVPGSRAGLYSAFALVLLAAFFMWFGFFTRVSALVTFLGLVSFQTANQAAFWSADDGIMRAFCLFLCFSKSDTKWSLMAVFRKKFSPQQSRKLTRVLTLEFLPPLGLRLIQVQLVLVYSVNFVAKMTSPEWRNGTALFYVSRFSEYQRFPVPLVFDHLLTIQIMTYASLAIELLLAAYFLLPARAQKVVFVAGIGFHAIMDYCLNIPFFQWLMISGLITFWPFRDGKKL